MNRKRPGTDKPYTSEEFLRIIKAAAEEKKLEYLNQLDYILAHDKETAMDSDDIRFTSITDYGCSEGIYTDFYINNGKKHVFTAKTLGETDEDYIKMHVLAANICLIASKYVREHEEEFNWTGFNVYRQNDDKTTLLYWSSSIENALNIASNIEAKGGKALIRNNATRKFVHGDSIKTVYKDQLIVKTPKGCFFYLYNEDGDIEEYKAADIEQAKEKIDEKEFCLGGLYNAGGEITKF